MAGHKQKNSGKNSRKNSGVIIPLSALMLTVMLSLVSLAYYILGYGAAAEMARSSAKLVVLGALEAYMALDCGHGANTTACHSQKMDAALARANEIAARNSGGLASVGFSDSQNGGSSSEFEALLTPMKWYFTKPRDSDPCSGAYPCGQPTGASELANAMKLQGQALDQFSRLLSFGFLKSQGSNEITYETTAVATPMHAMFVVDLSSSIVGDTHLAQEEAALIPPHWATFFSYPATSIKDPSLLKDYTPYADNASIAAVWSGTPSKRANGDSQNPSALNHYQDDYGLVFSYAESSSGRGAFKAAFGDTIANHHPEEGQDSAIVDRFVADNDKNAEVIASFLDQYRDQTYLAPEPLMSIAKGVRTFLARMQSRQVAGDKAGLVFADDKLTWNRVVNLTPDIDYLDSLLDFESGAQAEVPLNPNTKVSSNSVIDAPRWIQLGLIPFPNRNTDLFTALRMASTELATNGDLEADLSASGRANTPSVDFVVVFTDGLGNCGPSGGAGLTLCENTYAGYHSSEQAIENLAYNSFFKNKVPVHVVLAGSQSGPHIWKNSHATQNAGHECYTEAEMRQLEDNSPLSSVDQPACTSDSECQAKWNNRFTQPFTLAVKDWYNVAVRTGGVFTPLLPAGASCQVQNVTQICAQGISRRYDHDPLCRTAAAQVESSLDEILRGSHAFTIVETK